MSLGCPGKSLRLAEGNLGRPAYDAEPRGCPNYSPGSFAHIFQGPGIQRIIFIPTVGV